MPDYEQSVFISYIWGGEREDIVNEIDETLQQRISSLSSFVEAGGN